MLQKELIQATLKRLRFRLQIEQRIFASSDPGASPVITEVWMHEKGIGVELYESSREVVVVRAQLAPNGSITSKALICEKMKVFWSDPEMLEKFLSEFVGPAKTAKVARINPEA